MLSPKEQRTPPVVPSSPAPRDPVINPPASEPIVVAQPPRFPGSDFYPQEFVALLEQAVQNAIQEHTTGALLLVSVSNLSMIISAYGHETSETVMYDLTKMIEAILTENDIVRRLQRDQLGIILANSFPEDTQKTALRIHHAVQNFGRDNFSTASLHIIGTTGSVNFPIDTTGAHDALDKAVQLFRHFHLAVLLLFRRYQSW